MNEGGGVEGDDGIVATAEKPPSSGRVSQEIVAQRTDIVTAEGRHESSTKIAAQARGADGSEMKVSGAHVFSGPLPPPDFFKRYEEACPGAASRILGMAEAEGSHRRSLEKSAQDALVKDDGRGQWMGFVIIICAMMLGAWLIDKGHIVGVPVLFTAIGTLVTIAIWRRFDEKKVDKVEASQKPAE